MKIELIDTVKRVAITSRNVTSQIIDYLDKRATNLVFTHANKGSNIGAVHSQVKNQWFELTLKTISFAKNCVQVHAVKVFTKACESRL